MLPLIIIPTTIILAVLQLLVRSIISLGTRLRILKSLPTVLGLLPTLLHLQSKVLTSTLVLCIAVILVLTLHSTGLQVLTLCSQLIRASGRVALSLKCAWIRDCLKVVSIASICVVILLSTRTENRIITTGMSVRQTNLSLMTILPIRMLRVLPTLPPMKKMPTSFRLRVWVGSQVMSLMLKRVCV